MQGILLYGPPASGKSTITREIEKLDGRFALFRKIKVGGGRSAEYRVVDRSYLEDLWSRGEVVWENYRYDACYVVDRRGVVEMAKGGFPVVHLGQKEAIPTITEALHGQWLIVSLTCPRGIALQRIVDRGTGDTRARVKAWDETEPLEYADLTVDTGAVTAQQAAAEIIAAFSRRSGDAAS
ncbi:hypothetical protein BJF83_18860 [Nocardiopsis sp. CNR-923]|nr:hypothetical protein BJF83_18860 [Nocardiopsis sp. CNR-923]